MPNLCTNSLSLDGPPADVAAFVAAVDGHESITTALLPVPADQGANWYEWSLAHYGTKWGDYDTELVYHHGDTGALYRFTTAWTPLAEGVRRISVQFPTITFTLVYDEHGNELMGGYLIADGKILNEVSVASEDWPELQQDATGEELFDDWYEALNDLRDQVWSDVEAGATDVSVTARRSGADLPSIEVVPAISGGSTSVFVWLHHWVPNGMAAQSKPMTPDQARALAGELLLAADIKVPETA